jgi:hypothetical protein
MFITFSYEPWLKNFQFWSCRSQQDPFNAILQASIKDHLTFSLWVLMIKSQIVKLILNLFSDHLHYKFFSILWFDNENCVKIVFSWVWMFCTQMLCINE